MTAPRDILDALESVLSVYFSGVRHNLRSAFILCDGLVELTCKAKAEANGWTPKVIHFPSLLKLQQVGLDPQNGLGKKCDDSHKVRNKMHHLNAVATVDAQRCAEAILDAVSCIEHCLPGAADDFDARLKVALRVIRLFSAQGNPNHRRSFQDEMNRYRWRAGRTRARSNEIVVAPGNRSHWSLVIMDSVPDIETILSRIGIP